MNTYIRATRAARILRRHGYASRIVGGYLEGNEDMNRNPDQFQRITPVEAGYVSRITLYSWMGY